MWRAAVAEQQSDIIAVLGGTFDPIHHGHCQIAMAAKALLKAKKVFLMPSRVPVHRGVSASTDQRIAMIKAALIEYPGLTLSTLEVDSEQPSYSIETVTRLRQQYPLASLVFLMGMDAFRGFDSWKHWQTILDFVHLGVIRRPGESEELSLVMSALLQERNARHIEELSNSLSGKIFLLDIEGPNISATQLREQINNKEALRAWVPKEVAQIIEQEQIYKSDQQ